MHSKWSINSRYYNKSYQVRLVLLNGSEVLPPRFVHPLSKFCYTPPSPHFGKQLTKAPTLSRVYPGIGNTSKGDRSKAVGAFGLLGEKPQAGVKKIPAQELQPELELSISSLRKERKLSIGSNTWSLIIPEQLQNQFTLTFQSQLCDLGQITSLSYRFFLCKMGKITILYSQIVVWIKCSLMCENTQHSA